MARRRDALTRRQWLRQMGEMGAWAAVAAIAPACASVRSTASLASLPPALGFEPLGIVTLESVGGDAKQLDVVRLAQGYRHQVLFPWGAAIDGSSAELRVAATADEQQRQAGMNHDGMAFFPHDARWNPATGRLEGSSERGFLAMNHEYTDEGLLHADGVDPWDDPKVGAAKVEKSKCAQGVSVIAIERQGASWRVTGGRRISGRDVIEVRGPARGHALLRSSGDLGTPGERAGTEVQGTFANCANGQTPWGTYLTCEENFQDYFARSKAADDAKVEARMKRYGIGKTAPYVEGWRSVYGWDAHDPRFDADRPGSDHHCHRFGWVVEIDPADPKRPPAKRTALGRFSHENAAVVVAPDGRVVVYLGDDKRFEHVYKFVSRDRFEPVTEKDDEATRKAKREKHWRLLDEGSLYVAAFDDATAAGPTSEGERAGRWIELTPAHPKLAGRFADQAEVLVFAREAATLAGATKMDRPEWIAVLPGERPGLVSAVFVTLSNNDKRGPKGDEDATPSNPRASNVYGHVLRWREQDDDPAATTFRWKVAIRCGWHGHAVAEQRGDVRGALGREDQDFGSPDGLFVDPRGILWVQTDVNVKHLAGPDYAKLGNNQLVAIDPATLEARRFLVGPNGCEVTGATMTPDARTLFVNIQHPGELADQFCDPKNPRAVSAWPTGQPGDARPRSATLVITHEEGKPIGS